MLFSLRKGFGSFSLLLMLAGFSSSVNAIGPSILDNIDHSRHGGMTITLVNKATVDTMESESSPLEILSEEPRKIDPDNSVVTDRKDGSEFSTADNLPAAIAPTANKELYLTFDDGPISGTGNVLRVLRDEGVDASMFFVGRHAKLRPHLYNLSKQMSNILVANHTYSHANGHYQRFYSNTYGVMSDIEHAQLLLGGRKYLRLAGRNVWRTPEVKRDDRALGAKEQGREHSKYDTIAQEGFFIYGWDVEWHFDHVTGRPVGSAKAMARKIESIYRHGRSAQRGKVVLLAHDFMFRDCRSTEQLRRFIHLMRQKGWKFRKIDRYSRSKPEPLYIARYYKKSTIVLSAQKEAQTSVQQKSAHRKSAIVTRENTHPSAKIPVIVKQKVSLQAQLNDAIKAYASEQVEKILRQGVDINGHDEYGRIALNTAVKANSIFLVKKLLARGADLQRRDGRGLTPLQIAHRYGRRAIENYLIQYSLQNRAARHIAVAEQVRRKRDPLMALR